MFHVTGECYINASYIRIVVVFTRYCNNTFKYGTGEY